MPKLLVVPSKDKRQKFPWDEERTKSPSGSTLFSDSNTDTDNYTDTDTDTDTKSNTEKFWRRLAPRVFFCRFISTQDNNEEDVPVAI